MVYGTYNKNALGNTSKPKTQVKNKARCSCRKLGLNCVAACGDCRGEHCRNTRKTDDAPPPGEPSESGEDEFTANIFDLLNEYE